MDHGAEEIAAAATTTTPSLQRPTTAAGSSSAGTSSSSFSLRATATPFSPSTPSSDYASQHGLSPAEPSPLGGIGGGPQPQRLGSAFTPAFVPQGYAMGGSSASGFEGYSMYSGTPMHGGASMPPGGRYQQHHHHAGGGGGGGYYPPSAGHAAPPPQYPRGMASGGGGGGGGQMRGFGSGSGSRGGGAGGSGIDAEAGASQQQFAQNGLPVRTRAAPQNLQSLYSQEHHDPSAWRIVTPPAPVPAPAGGGRGGYGARGGAGRGGGRGFAPVQHFQMPVLPPETVVYETGDDEPSPPPPRCFNPADGLPVEWVLMAGPGGARLTVPRPMVPNEGLPTKEEHVHSSLYTPAGQAGINLHLVYYNCHYCIPTSDTIEGKLTTRPPDLKLGGVCGDVSAKSIAHLLYVITQVKVIAIDMFGRNFGRCNLWLEDPEVAPALIQRLDRRMWMPPLTHGFAVVCNDEDARKYLFSYLENLRLHGPKKVMFPRHLVTADRWTV